MGIERKPEPDSLTAVQLDQMIGLAHTVGRVLRMGADFMDLFGDTLVDYKRARAALRSGRTVYRMVDFVGKVTDTRIAEMLSRANIVKFEANQLWLEAQSEFDSTYLKLVKKLIQKELKQEFGVDFQIRIA